MSAITIFSLCLENQYVAGPSQLEEIEIPFSITFLLSVLLTISYGIHFRHFYIVGLLARILFWTYETWTIIQDVLFY